MRYSTCVVFPAMCRREKSTVTAFEESGETHRVGIRRTHRSLLYTQSGIEEAALPLENKCFNQIPIAILCNEI